MTTFKFISASAVLARAIGGLADNHGVELAGTFDSISDALRAVDALNDRRVVVTLLHATSTPYVAADLGVEVEPGVFFVRLRDNRIQDSPWHRVDDALAREAACLSA